jgi:hypothetical protein
MEKLIILILITSLTACGHKSSDTNKKAINAITETKVEIDSKNIKEKIPTETEIYDPEILVKIENNKQFDKQKSDYQIDGYLIEIEEIDKVYKLINELDSVVLKFQFETSISVSNEGKHCDLVDWKKGYSEWLNISHRIEKKGYFRCYWQTNIDSNYYPKMNLEEIKNYVKKNCGSDWYNLIKDFQSIDSFYINVGASMYNFKINGINPTTGGKIEKIFSFPIMMGC